MPKKLPETVDNCEECPFYQHVSVRYCTLLEKKLDPQSSFVTVHKDCPLPDADDAEST